jgi:hypothetical protein
VLLAILEDYKLYVLTHPQAHSDGKEVYVADLVSNLTFKTSKRGNPYTTFELKEEKGQTLTVFSYGTLPIKARDEMKVRGIYKIENRVGKYVFYNEIVARRVSEAKV